MFDVGQFRQLIVKPTLQQLGLYSPAAENLVTGTAAHESGGFAYLHQVNGPALGLFQIEPATADDVWQNSLTPAFHALVAPMLAAWPDRTTQLITNLVYATAMCRLIYWRVPRPLPAAFDIGALAAYWLVHYNAGGKGTVEAWMENYHLFAGAPV